MDVRTFPTDVCGSDETVNFALLTEPRAINFPASLPLTEINNINKRAQQQESNPNYQQQDVSIYFFSVLLSVSQKGRFHKGEPGGGGSS